ncbi:MAG: dTMP kinase [Deltaproteobacteria bacterium]|nr:dTMP kinase [Deltaproteobacteria bacterium]
MNTGIFITFEGIEGCGKTTQIKMLREYLESKGCSIIVTREPGGTGLGEKIRTMLLNSGHEPFTAWTELFLYEACRLQIIEEVIKPALTEGRIVICDRYIDSTTAYQGYGKGLDLQTVTWINKLVAGRLLPDLTFIIDCNVETGLTRAWTRINSIGEADKEDRFEKEGAAFHEKVRNGYLKIAANEPERIKVIDGEREIEAIHKDVCEMVDKILPKLSD